MEQLYITPFLGVARSALTNSKKRKSHNHKTCHKTKVTVLNNCVHGNINDAVPQFKAKARTEEYKTDEQKICISVIKKDNQTDLTPESCDRTADTEGITSKVFTDICEQSINQGARLSTAKSFDDAACAIVGRNNNVTFKDITIDVVGHGTDLFLPHSNELNESAQNGQNLLAIAGHLDYSSKLAKKSLTPTTLAKLSNATTESITIEHQKVSDDQQQNGSESRSVDDLISDTSCKSVKNLCPNKLLLNATNQNDLSSANMDGNISSRRSSSCSNSSLKLTQQSINLKLKRQFQEQKLLDINGERNRRRRKFNRRSSIDNKDDENPGQENKQPRIKRIKIAINGDVATQMQISGGSSNNSTDEDNEEGPTDTCSVNDENDNDDGDEFVADEENELAVKVGAAREDVESTNSAGSRVSTYHRFNLANADVELDANSAKNSYNDEQEIGCDYGDPDVDADVEFDENEDGEDYNGYFHEVVTRDISAPSTGNNHIVLTIKKTPSKTNSPLNSLSALSPSISNNTNGSQTSGIIISPIISKTSVHTANSVGDIDMNALIVKKLEVGDGTITEPSMTALETSTLSNSVKEIQSLPLCHTEMDITNDIPNVEISLPKRSFIFDPPKSLASASSLEFAPSTAKYLYKEYRCRPKIKKAENGPTECPRDLKLHHVLFFPHELITSDYDGIKRSILNISSCSSSCTEDGEYDDDNESATIGTSCETKENSRLSTHSQMGIKLETNSDVSVLQQRKRNSSTSSCSTYSSSTCDSLIEYQVKSESYSNDFGDPSSEAADIEVKSEESGRESVEKQRREDNEVNSESSPTVNTPYYNQENGHTLADTTDKNKEDVKEELPSENNGLLHSFNNIYYRADTLEAQTHDITINDDNIIESKNSHLMCGNVVVGPAAIDAAKQQEQKLPNKNCDDYNNLYNKNSNNINLIRYCINAPSLVYRNKQSDSCNEVDQQQKGNYFNTGDDCNANTDVYVSNDDRELIVDDDNNKNANNVGSTQTEYKADDKADLSFNISGEDYGKVHTASSSMQSCCAQVILPRKEYRTGLRAVDEDVHDDDGNNCARIQQFKEWHQVLHLRSYNDEPLTVLPYVVLD